jgi:hypothetical protein
MRTSEFGGCRELVLHRLGDRRGGNVLDETLAPIDLLRPVSIDIEAEHLKLALHGRKRQRNPDITEAHDSDYCLAGSDRLPQSKGLLRLMGHVRRLLHSAFRGQQRRSGDRAVLPEFRRRATDGLIVSLFRVEIRITLVRAAEPWLHSNLQLELPAEPSFSRQHQLPNGFCRFRPGSSRGNPDRPRSSFDSGRC